MPETGFVAVLVIHLHFPDAGDLKGKRKELSSIKAGLHRRLGAAVSEVDYHDRWQRSTLAAALTARSQSGLEEAVAGLRRYLDSRCPDGVWIEELVASIDELRDLVPAFKGAG